MRLGQPRHHLGEELQPDQEAVQRVVVQFVAAAKELVEHRAVLLEVALEQRLREIGLVLEMIEEAALGDADRGDDLLDRGRGESLREHRLLGGRENPLARLAAPSCRNLQHANCTIGQVVRRDCFVTSRKVFRRASNAQAFLEKQYFSGLLDRATPGSDRRNR